MQLSFVNLSKQEQIRDAEDPSFHTSWRLFVAAALLCNVPWWGEVTCAAVLASTACSRKDTGNQLSMLTPNGIRICVQLEPWPYRCKVGHNCILSSSSRLIVIKLQGG